MKAKVWMIIVGLFSIVAAACNQPERATVFPSPAPGPSQTWIDDPLPNSNLPLLPYKIVFHGASFVGVTEFELQINGVVIATVPPVSSGSGGPQYGTMFLGEYTWNPPAPGTYLIRVRAKGNGQFSPPDQVQVTVGGGKDTPLPLEPVPTPTNTLVAARQCTFTASISLFCYLGPGTHYQKVDTFDPGQSAPIVGQSPDSSFWYVLGPRSGLECAVPTTPRMGEADGDCDELPRFTPMPLPTPTNMSRPTPCPAGARCPQSSLDRTTRLVHPANRG